MSFWPLFKSVAIAVVLSPFVASLIGLAWMLATGAQSPADTAKILIGLPIIAAVLLFLGGIPVFLGTSVVAGALTLVQRHLLASRLILWGVGLAAFATIPMFLSRYPDGDGGSMQSMVETIKAMGAASVGIWCVLAALRPKVLD